MRRALPALVCVLLLPAGAAARIAVEPLRAILERATPDVAACQARGLLPAGRYAIRIELSMAEGKATAVRVGDAPAPLSPAAESCLRAAYARLAFPARPRPPEEATVATTFRGRQSRVPGRHAWRPPDRIGIVWPIVLVDAE